MTNHLWQSTLFAAVVALLTFGLRKNPARVRHWLWLAASVKFLVPFSLLVGIGSQFSWRSAAPPALNYVMENVSRQISPPSVQLAAAAPASILWPVLGAVAWVCGCAAILLMWFVRWWRLCTAVRSARSLQLRAPIIAKLSSALMEPGVFGIRRPVLLLPEGITERLTAEQLDAIVAHELCHVRRRDNLAAAIHMVVEAVFWFHPLVWWIGARLVEERERACDEEVLQSGKEPEVYAEGILKVCRLYLESPLVCVSGVTGSDLKKRVETIMKRGVTRELDVGRKAALAAAAFAAIAGPVAVGIVNAPPIRAQSQQQERLAFEVASVKPAPANADPRGGGLDFLPNGRVSARSAPLFGLVAMAYSVPFQGPRLTGLPKELAWELYDIEAVAPAGAIPAGASKRVRDQILKRMLQTLLEERFKMQIRRETKELPVYAIVVGKNGPKLKKAKVEEKDCSESPGDNKPSCHSFNGGMGRGIHSAGMDMSDLALGVSNWSDRPVVDRTGLSGLFELDTEGWSPMQPRGPDANEAETKALSDPTRPTLYMILDRLGLKLESSKAPIEMFVVEHIERPSAN
jgi:bla regulator protein BlaR1